MLHRCVLTYFLSASVSPKTTAPECSSIPKCFQQWIGFQHLLFYLSLRRVIFSAQKGLFCSINSSETATDLHTVEVGALVTSPSAAPAIARNFLKTHGEQICGSTGCALWSKGSESEAFQGTIVIQNDQVHQGFLTSLYKSFKS